MGLLFIFDFDWSLVNENSDVFLVRELSEELYTQLLAQYRSDEYAGQWTKFMDMSFGKLHEAGFTRADMEAVLKRLPFDERMVARVRQLKATGADLRIVSDANTFFIDTILRAHGLEDVFTEVVTNPAQFNDAGRLVLSPLRAGDPSLDKAPVMDRLLKEVEPERVVYVGDGENDFSAACRLRQCDAVFARADYKLHKCLLAAPHPKPPVSFGVWRDYGELDELLATQRSKPDFVIQQMVPEDWPQVAAIFQHGIDMGNATFATEPPSWEEWDANHVQVPRLVARQGDVIIGWSAISPVSARVIYQGVVEMSVYVSAASRGLGLGKALVRDMIPKSEAEGIWTLEARMVAENTACVRLHEACGFRMVGRREKLGKLRGEWRDAIIMERRSPSII